MEQKILFSKLYLAKNILQGSDYKGLSIINAKFAFSNRLPGISAGLILDPIDPELIFVILGYDGDWVMLTV